MHKAPVKQFYLVPTIIATVFLGIPLVKGFSFHILVGISVVDQLLRNKVKFMVHTLYQQKVIPLALTCLRKCAFRNFYLLGYISLCYCRLSYVRREVSMGPASYYHHHCYFYHYYYAHGREFFLSILSSALSVIFFYLFFIYYYYFLFCLSHDNS